MGPVAVPLLRKALILLDWLSPLGSANDAHPLRQPPEASGDLLEPPNGGNNWKIPNILAIPRRVDGRLVWSFQVWSRQVKPAASSRCNSLQISKSDRYCRRGISSRQWKRKLNLAERSLHV